MDSKIYKGKLLGTLKAVLLYFSVLHLPV